MEARWLIVDGYSLLYRDRELAARPRPLLSSARRQIVRRVEEVAGSLAERITIVFDGAGSRAEEEASTLPPVEVVFSPRDRTADTVIERLVHEHPRPAEILVVTSDRMERETVGAAGAQTISCGDFLDECERLRRAPRGGRRGKPDGGRPTLGDFFHDRREDGSTRKDA